MSCKADTLPPWLKNLQVGWKALGLHREAEPVTAPPKATPSPTPGAGPAATCTGRIYLMFPSSLIQGRLESVWEDLDQLDQVDGGRNITDTRLVS